MAWRRTWGEMLAPVTISTTRWPACAPPAAKNATRGQATCCGRGTFADTCCSCLAQGAMKKSGTMLLADQKAELAQERVHFRARMEKAGAEGVWEKFQGRIAVALSG